MILRSVKLPIEQKNTKFSLGKNNNLPNQMRHNANSGKKDGTQQRRMHSSSLPAVSEL